MPNDYRPMGRDTHRRVPQGQTNAVAYMQSSLSLIIPNKLQEQILRWIGDMLLHAHIIDHLYNIRKEFFELCRKH